MLIRKGNQLYYQLYGGGSVPGLSFINDTIAVGDVADQYIVSSIFFSFEATTALSRVRIRLGNLAGSPLIIYDVTQGTVYRASINGSFLVTLGYPITLTFDNTAVGALNYAWNATAVDVMYR